MIPTLIVEDDVMKGFSINLVWLFWHMDLIMEG